MASVLQAQCCPANASSGEPRIVDHPLRRAHAGSWACGRRDSRKVVFKNRRGRKEMANHELWMSIQRCTPDRPAHTRTQPRGGANPRRAQACWRPSAGRGSWASGVGRLLRQSVTKHSWRSFRMSSAFYVDEECKARRFWGEPWAVESCIQKR